MNGSGGAASSTWVPSQAPAAMPTGMNQKRRTSSPRLPPRSAEITTSASVTGASSVIADFMSITSATSGVATSGKPKPSAPCAKPASRHTSATYASTRCSQRAHRGASTSARCSVGRPASDSICSRQEKPFATTTASGAPASAGSSARPAMRREASTCSGL